MIPKTWSNIDYLVDLITNRIRSSGKQYDNIYGICRGGMIPAVMLSHKLNIFLSLNTITNTTLVVDDIADGGKTLEKLIHDYPSIYFDIAVLFCRFSSTIRPTYIGENLNHNVWIKFPWESVNSSKYDNT
jgi:hypoxanthine phosphoribosyltransferase